MKQLLTIITLILFLTACGKNSSPSPAPSPSPTPAKHADVLIDASRTFSPNTWTNGNYSADESMSVAIPASLSVLSGNAGNQTATLTIGTIVCTYKGGASGPHPSSVADIALGLFYNLNSCVDASLALYTDSSVSLSLGDPIVFRINGGDSNLGSVSAEADFDVLD